LSVPEREACARCGEPVSIDARECAFCSASALVDVVLPGPIRDGRTRFQVARALSALGQPITAGVRPGQLAVERPVVATGLTISAARRVGEVLATCGLTSALERPPRRLPWAGMIAGAVVLFVAVLGVYLWSSRPPSLPAQPTPGSPSSVPSAAATPVQPSVSDIAERSLPSTVTIHCRNASGAGFFVSDELLLTNAHVACPMGEPMQIVFSDGRQLTGLASRSDTSVDLSLVQVSGAEAKPLPLGDAGSLRVGDPVIMIGNPVSLSFTVHQGSVSSVSRTILGVAYIQLDIKINPGNSGGPLLDRNGRVVGIVSMKAADAEGIGLALPINYAYVEPYAFISAPPDLPLSPGFEAMQTKAAEEERKTVGELGAIPLQPGLVAARMNPQGRLRVRIVNPSRYEPGTTQYTINVLSGTDVLCRLYGAVDNWKRLESNDPGDAMNARVSTWLARFGLDVALYWGDADMDLGACDRARLRRGITLELVGGHPDAARLQF
jgi:serine protease Do